LGAALGAVVAARSGSSTNPLVAIAYSSLQVRASSESGDPGRQRDALSRHLAILESYGTATVYPTDTIATLFRLGETELRLQNAAGAAEWFERAQKACSDARWDDCSDDALGRVSTRAFDWPAATENDDGS
jgi:hypothetical protein